MKAVREDGFFLFLYWKFRRNTDSRNFLCFYIYNLEYKRLLNEITFLKNFWV